MLAVYCIAAPLDFGKRKQAGQGISVQHYFTSQLRFTAKLPGGITYKRKSRGTSAATHYQTMTGCKAAFPPVGRQLGLSTRGKVAVLRALPRVQTCEPLALSHLAAEHFIKPSLISQIQQKKSRKALFLVKMLP